MARTLARVAFPLVAAALLGGCILSEVPLGPSSEAVRDPALFGKWIGKEPTDTLEITEDAAIRGYQARSRSINKHTGKPQEGLYRGWTTKFRGLNFANLRSSDAKDKTYLLFQYEIRGDELRAAWLKTVPKPYTTRAALRTAVRALIKDKTLWKEEPITWRRAPSGPPPIAPEDFPHLVPAK